MTVSNKSAISQEFKGTRKISAEEFKNLPRDGLRHALVGGYHIVSTAPSFFHQSVAIEIAYLLKHFARQNHLGKAMMETMIELSGDDILIPDVYYIAKKDLHLRTEKSFTGVPSIVIEIVSKGSENWKRDYQSKREAAERHGVPEYWAVNPELEMIDFFTLQKSGKYDYIVLKATENDILVSSIPELQGFKLNLKELFEEARK